MNKFLEVGLGSTAFTLFRFGDDSVSFTQTTFASFFLFYKLSRDFHRCDLTSFTNPEEINHAIIFGGNRLMEMSRNSGI
jgi:hypothetical protein